MTSIRDATISDLSTDLAEAAAVDPPSANRFASYFQGEARRPFRRADHLARWLEAFGYDDESQRAIRDDVRLFAHAAPCSELESERVTRAIRDGDAFLAAIAPLVANLVDAKAWRRALDALRLHLDRRHTLGAIHVNGGHVRAGFSVEAQHSIRRAEHAVRRAELAARHEDFEVAIREIHESLQPANLIRSSPRRGPVAAVEYSHRAPLLERFAYMKSARGETNAHLARAILSSPSWSDPPLSVGDLGGRSISTPVDVEDVAHTIGRWLNGFESARIWRPARPKSRLATRKVAATLERKAE